MISQQTLSLEGRPAKYWIGGAGKPLVLLHGGLGDAQQHWSASFEALTPHFQIIAPDLPGFGVSAPLPLPSYQAYLRWLQSLFDVLGLGGPILLMGNSFGAALARLFAPVNFDQIERLVLVDGGALPARPGCLRPLLRLPVISSWIIEQLRQRYYSRDGLKRAIHIERLLTPEFVVKAQAASHGFVATLREVFSVQEPTLRTPTCPTLIVWGDSDRLSPPEGGRQLAASIPGSHFELIRNAGHMPQIEQPAAFHQIVLAFLSSHSSIAA
jgi:pimeloyl-ACP methyl ester carboxylesterase